MGEDDLLRGNLKGWSKGGVVNPPKSTNKDTKGESNLSLQCQLNPPGVYTVQFEVGPPIGNIGEGNENIPVATIEWAVNGNTIRRKVSVLNGVSISGPAQAVKVVVLDESQAASALPYSVGITVTPGTRGGDAPPTLQNVPPDQAPAAAMAVPGTVTFPIPEDVGASQFRVLIWPDTAPLAGDNFSIAQLDAASVLINAFQNPIISEWVPIAPGATTIEISNYGATIANVFIIFGIDG